LSTGFDFFAKRDRQNSEKIYVEYASSDKIENADNCKFITITEVVIPALLPPSTVKHVGFLAVTYIGINEPRYFW
jgi:hypothetical protein